jgi:hypothetical protein
MGSEQDPLEVRFHLSGRSDSDFKVKTEERNVAIDRIDDTLA